MSELCVEPLWYGEQPNAIARQLKFCCILILKKVQSFKYIISSAEYTITRKRIFLFPCRERFSFSKDVQCTSLLQNAFYETFTGVSRLVNETSTICVMLAQKMHPIIYRLFRLHTKY
jgi:hypothetical protein